ncbi:MAG: cytochrome c oxidase subunit I [Flavobacteriales bacterium]|nr:hypothetical protein [Flavobacteriales bacterium]MCC6575844.1 cytochrome c oxidase subunit I [Flavobacteriales bacterium]NUQ13849.1 cytochrome C oxidase subunit I [Flavobacteriales bacterium]
MTGSPLGNVARTTSHRVVIPFYVYGAAALLVATVMLLVSHRSFTGHYFQPHLLAITHTMALGWATMIILGAGHQLFPVLVETDLYSEGLARASFLLAAVGIPLLVYGFHSFDLGLPARLGGTLVLGAVLAFMANIGMGLVRSKRENVHAVFVFTSTAWLLLTAALGLALLFNFTRSLLPHDSVHYLGLHAHLGIVGWFLLLVLGVGSRLVPMFLISKYTAPRLLWAVFILVNTALLGHTVFFLVDMPAWSDYVPVTMVAAALLLFAHYCRQAYRQRIRRKVDAQMRVTLLAVALMLLPTAVLLVLLTSIALGGGAQVRVALLYGFTIFFGWLTAIILGMTFKTLPFIVWNKVYRPRATLGRMPGPKDLFSDRLFLATVAAYLAGFTLFGWGIAQASVVLLKIGAVALLATALLYNWSIGRMVFIKQLGP